MDFVCHFPGLSQLPLLSELGLRHSSANRRRIMGDREISLDKRELCHRCSIDTPFLGSTSYSKQNRVFLNSPALRNWISGMRLCENFRRADCREVYLRCWWSRPFHEHNDNCLFSDKSIRASALSQLSWHCMVYRCDLSADFPTTSKVREANWLQHLVCGW